MFVRILRAEVLKAATLRALALTVLLAPLAGVAFSMLDSGGVSKMLLTSSGGLAEGVTADTVGLSNMLLFGFVPVVVGVLLASGEYGGGQLVTSVLASPRRGRLLAAKALLAIFVNAVLGSVFAAVVLLAYQGRLGALSVYARGTFPEYAGRLGMSIAYWVLIGLIALAFTIVLRSQIVPMAVMVLLAFAGMALLLISPVFQYLPTIAGMQMFNPEQGLGLPNRPTLGTGDATLVLVGWTVGLALLAGLLSSAGTWAPGRRSPNDRPCGGSEPSMAAVAL